MENTRNSILLKILPPVWFLIFLLLGLAIHFFLPTARIFDFSYPIFGIALLVFGFVLSNYASALFSKEKTEILPTSETNRVLVVYGPFKYSRNPMYLGMVLSLLGVAVWVGSLPMFVATALDFTVLNFVFIPFEEKKMARIFGEQFETYKKKVRRWL
jgi:protein-S-isoprenylcysteine O-methyltransferase Ste14